MLPLTAVNGMLIDMIDFVETNAEDREKVLSAVSKAEAVCQRAANLSGVGFDLVRGTKDIPPLDLTPMQAEAINHCVHDLLNKLYRCFDIYRGITRGCEEETNRIPRKYLKSLYQLSLRLLGTAYMSRNLLNRTRSATLLDLESNDQFRNWADSLDLLLKEHDKMISDFYDLIDDRILPIIRTNNAIAS